MLDSPYSSEVHPPVTRMIGARAFMVLCLLALPWLSGCVTVRPQDKEFLAERGMIFGAEGMIAAQEEHVFENREGSFGGGSITGGGCGCN